MRKRAEHSHNIPRNMTHADVRRSRFHRLHTRASHSPPYLVLNVVASVLSSYSWSGSPSSQGATDSHLADYLTTSTSPVALNNTPLVDGAGALGDPCSLGAATWIAAEFFSQSGTQGLYSNARKGMDYAWAVGGQYEHLESGVRGSTGESRDTSGEGGG